MDRRTAITGAGSGIGQVVVRLCGRGRTALRDASDAIHVIAPVRHDAIRRMLLCLTLLLTAALPAQAQQRVLNVYNWTDYIDPAALKRFEKEINAKVNYDEFDSLETLEAKLLAGHSGYDIVVPSDEPSFSRLIKDGALAPIDHADIPNWKNLDPALMRRVGGVRSRQRAWCDLSVSAAPAWASIPTGSERWRPTRRSTVGTCCSNRNMRGAWRPAASSCWIRRST